MLDYEVRREISNRQYSRNQMFYSAQNQFSPLTFLSDYILFIYTQSIYSGGIEPTFSLGANSDPRLANHSIPALT